MDKLYASIFIIIILYILITTCKIEHFKNNNNNKYYLIANNPEIKVSDIMKFANNINNTLIFFNHIEPFKKFNSNDLKNLNNSDCKKLLFLRSNHLNSFWGKTEYDNQKIKIFNRNNTIIILSDNTKNLKNPYNLRIVDYKKYIKKYPGKKQPQTGFVCYHYINSITNKKNIFLYGFSRKQGEHDGDWCHEKTYELDYYKKNNVNNIEL
jgi:hypothetical protein